MREIDDTYVGDVVAGDDLVVTGLVDGSLTALAGTLHLIGGVRKDLVVSGKDVMALIDGSVAGTLRVHRGIAVVTGSVYAAVVRDDGILIFRPGAMVAGERVA